MKLGYCLFYVDDVPKTVAFYEKAFQLKTRFVDDSKNYGEMDTGGTTLGFVSKELIKTNGFDFGQLGVTKAPPPMEIAFLTDDVQKAVAHAVENGATLLKEPLVKPWGQTVAYVKDLNGFLVELCTPVG